jgi:hypothetical protein
MFFVKLFKHAYTNVSHTAKYKEFLRNLKTLRNNL